MIRPAMEADLEALVELGRQMHAESWYAHMPFDDAVLRLTLQKILQVGFAYVHERPSLVDGEANKVDGGMIGLLCPSWFGPGYYAADLSIFVTANARGGLTAYRLVDAFIDWAKRNGAMEVNLGISTNVQPDLLGGLYERIGFTRVGGIYKLRMSDV